MPTSASVHIFKRAPEYSESEPFRGDLFGRKALAEKLTAYLDRLPDGCVIGLTGDWGSGKSWFAQNWRGALKEDHVTFYLDAFENDYSNDAFVVITSEIIRGLSGNKTRPKLLSASKKVGAALLPIAGKIIVNAGVKVVTGQTAADWLKEIADEAAKAGAIAAEKLIEKKIKDHEQDKNGVLHFRKTLHDYCAAQKKPVVFFIDELDRCRPSFAVQVIERIKHFFDVPNLVFILLLNRRQLEAAVEGIYGVRVEADSYLSKFVHFFVSLPNPYNDAGGRQLANFCQEVAHRHGYPQAQWVENFSDVVIAASGPLSLSLRDVERLFILFGLTSGINNSSHVAAYIALIKLKRPALFSALQTGTAEAHRQAGEFAQSLVEREPNYWLWRSLAVLHKLHAKNEFQNMSAEERDAMEQLSGTGSGRARASIIPWLVSQFDLSLPE